MRERLIQYVDLLFAAAPGAEEIKQEILQNTLDRYDDLVSQGKSEEAAYRLAISGIGDINEILDAPAPEAAPTAETAPEKAGRTRAVAIALYIVCAVPLFVLSELGLDTIGLCLTLALVAVATYLLLLSRKPGTAKAPEKPKDPRKVLIDRIGTVVSITAFLLVSFLTGAWYITWLIFPICGCVEGLISAILDLKEAIEHEN